MSFHHSKLFSNQKIMKSVLTFYSLFVCVIAAGPKVDYCFVPCKDSYFDVHLICKRLHSCPKPKNCDVYEPNKKWRQLMLYIFNDARNAVANGTKKFGYGNPGATKMNALSYDLELEYIITCHLNQCDTTDYLEGCQDSVRFPTEYVGYAIHSRVDFDMDLWWTAITVYTGVNIKCNARTDEGVKFRKNPPDAWHFIYFWKAKYLGCSAVRRRDWTTILCIIGPVRLKESDLVYKVAKHRNDIASECENGRNKKYPALCGNIEEVPAEKMWAHQNITFNSSEKLIHVNYSLKVIMISIMVRIIFEV